MAASANHIPSITKKNSTNVQMREGLQEPAQCMLTKEQNTACLGHKARAESQQQRTNATLCVPITTFFVHAIPDQ